MRGAAAWTAAAVMTTWSVSGGQPRVDDPGTAPSQIASRAILHGGIDAGEAVAVSSAGVTVRNAGIEYVIGWDRVARVDGPLSVETVQFRELATLAWRARTRLERGDAVAAEPLYEELFDRLAEVDGPTALSICEGLLRCRLWRGAHAGALEAWLHWVRLAGSDVVSGPAEIDSTDARSRIWQMALVPVIDDETGLVMSLPPVWLPGPSVRAMVARAAPPQRSEEQGDGAARALALRELYLHAARYEGGDRRAVPAIDPTMLEDPGVALVADIVLARSGDGAQREAARASLRSRLGQELPGWQDAWCRVGLGRSLLLEEDDAKVMAGVVELMHMPARFGEEQPYLTGVALGEAAVALRGLGDPEGAAILEAMLQQTYSGHPALEWTELPAPGRASSSQAPGAVPRGPVESQTPIQAPVAPSSGGGGTR